MAISQKRKDDIIKALLVYPTIEEVAKATRVNKSTIYRLLNEDEAFRSDYNTARSEALKETARTLQTALTPAIKVLTDTIADEEVKPQIRLNAVDMLLRHFYKVEEVTNIEERLEALEQEKDDSM